MDFFWCSQRIDVNMYDDFRYSDVTRDKIYSLILKLNPEDIVTSIYMHVNTRAVPEVHRQSLKCFKMTSNIDISLHVNIYKCVFHIMNIHKQFYRTLLHKW